MQLKCLVKLTSFNLALGTLIIFKKKKMTSEDGVEVKFILGDVLPTYYDAAISIFSVASKPGTAKIKAVIRSYAFMR